MHLADLQLVHQLTGGIFLQLSGNSPDLQGLLRAYVSRLLLSLCRLMHVASMRPACSNGDDEVLLLLLLLQASPLCLTSTTGSSAQEGRHKRRPSSEHLQLHQHLHLPFLQQGPVM
jgi:hypothetical protein